MGEGCGRREGRMGTRRREGREGGEEQPYLARQVIMKLLQR